MENIIKIAEFILESFLHIWPYLVITVPLSVAVKLSGSSNYINSTFRKRPIIAIMIATLIGAISPFCSCGVIPVIASLLISGVPIGPVMSFWIASPSMDPEIFFLSVSVIGWELAIWRLGSTLILSLMAGLISHYLDTKNLLGNYVISLPAVCCTSDGKQVSVQLNTSKIALQSEGTCTRECSEDTRTFRTKLLSELWKASYMVIKFMLLAFFINAIIQFYVPKDYITRLLGGDNTFSIIIASFVGVPVYTTNLTALPMISGLLSLGMNPAAALAFLIAGPTTTLPAMSAVWGITNRKVFILYISFVLTGAMIFGFAYYVFAG